MFKGKQAASSSLKSSPRRLGEGCGRVEGHNWECNIPTISEAFAFELLGPSLDAILCHVILIVLVQSQPAKLAIDDSLHEQQLV